jgi:cold shock CspA family protein
MSSTQETTDDVQTNIQDARLVGQVKWFNNKAGYGFITVSDGELADKDIFIHYSSIRVTNSQYKYLVQGEYVEFSLSKPNGDVHEFQASDVSGIKSGALMCETRRQSRPASTDGNVPAPSTNQRRFRTNRQDGAPRQKPADSEGFTEVRKRQAPRKKAPSTKPLPETTDA